MKKLLLAALSLGLVSAFGLSFKSNHLNMAKAENENTLRVSCENTLTENNTYSASVYLRTYEQISALSLEVHFNEDVLTVNNLYNSISANVYDSAIHDDYVSYSYIFNSVDVDYEQQLFYFYFTINNGVTAGIYYFDVVVTEAYGTSFEDVSVLTSRKNFTVVNQPTSKNTYAYTYTSNINTSVGNTFDFTYYLASVEPSSGTFVITYDDELFEFVSLTKGHFFDTMISDYNAQTTGQIYISFAALSQATSSDLFTVTLRSIANVTTSSEISMNASDLYDNDMYLMTFSAYNITVNVSYDSSYEVNPKMSTSYSLDTVNHLITLDIDLEVDSHLGAGDFVLSFDKTKVTYVSSTNDLSPSTLTINDKQQHLDQGRVKFSILSLTDIVDAEDLLTVVFSYNESSQVQNIVFGLEGDGLTDSLTNPIQLDISGVTFDIAATDFIMRWADTYLYMNDNSFDGNGTGRCLSEGLYATAKEELLKLDQYSVDAFSNNLGNRYTDALDRYLAWAAACGDATPFEDNGLNSSIVRFNNQQHNYILIAVVSISFVAATSLLFVIKRRKHQ